MWVPPPERRTPYLFTGVRPSSAAATWARSSVWDIGEFASFSSVSAPEDGRTPLKAHRTPLRPVRTGCQFLSLGSLALRLPQFRAEVVVSVCARS